MPVPRGREVDFAADGKVNIAAFWDHMDMPRATSDDGGVWALGESANDRAESLCSLQAPDFTLPDLAGVAHSHPGGGIPTPSWEDLTTFAAVEDGLGQRLVWWIVSEAFHCWCVFHFENP